MLKEITYGRRMRYGMNTTDQGAFSFLLQPCTKYHKSGLLTVPGPEGKFLTCIVPMDEDVVPSDIVGWITHNDLTDIPSEDLCFEFHMLSIGEVLDTAKEISND